MRLPNRSKKIHIRIGGVEGTELRYVHTLAFLVGIVRGLGDRLL